MIQLKRKEIHDAKDTQLRDVLNYQGKIEKLQHQVDQMQVELESSRKSQLAEVEALTQTKEGLVKQLEGMAKQVGIKSEAERSNMKAKVEKGKRILAHLEDIKAYETDYFSALKALK